MLLADGEPCEARQCNLALFSNPNGSPDRCYQCPFIRIVENEDCVPYTEVPKVSSR